MFDKLRMTHDYSFCGCVGEKMTPHRTSDLMPMKVGLHGSMLTHIHSIRALSQVTPQVRSGPCRHPSHPII